jgi:hypothetical protein
VSEALTAEWTCSVEMGYFTDGDIRRIRARFDVFTAMKIQVVTVFRVVTPCSDVVGDFDEKELVSRRYITFLAR